MEKQSLSGEKRGSGRRKMRHPNRSLSMQILEDMVCDFLAKEKLLQSETGSPLKYHSVMQDSSSMSFLSPKKEAPECSKRVKKSLKRKKPKKETRTNPSKKPKNVKVLDQQLELPMTFKEKIQELEGCDVKLVIQKELFKSDLNPNLGRFSIPIKQIREEVENLLTQSEESSLDEREGNKKQMLHGLPVLVLDPCRKHYNMCLKKWSMKKTEVYNITSGWNDVVRNNDLKVKDMVQLWSFRSKNQLCFAVVKLQKASI